MDNDPIAQRLSRIQTRWSMVFQAHRGQGEAVIAAQQQLLLRYHGAVYRYFLAMLREPDGAEELTQEFAVRFLRGDFNRADPQRGRFRDFVKTAVRHLAIDYWQKKKKRGKETRPLSDESGLAAGATADAASDQEFLKGWREELLAHTWEALAKAQGEKPTPYHTVLRFKTEHPEARSAEIAKQLGAQLERSFTETGIRQTLHRAREMFADLLVDEVARSLQSPDAASLEQELIDLDLLDYCRSSLDRRARRS